MNTRVGSKLRGQRLNKRVMPKPNLRFVSRMAFGHLMRFTALPVCLGIHGRYTVTENVLSKNVIILMIGIIIGVGVTIPMIFSVKKDAFEHGKGIGYVEGVQFAIKSLESEFGSISYESKNYKNVIFAIKTQEVVAVDINGIKTVKVTGF